MSPTIFWNQGFRYYFFSREESRMRVHVQHADGEAKFWLSPSIKLATSIGLNQNQLKSIERKIKEKEDEIRQAWKKHFA